MNYELELSKENADLLALMIFYRTNFAYHPTKPDAASLFIKFMHTYGDTIHGIDKFVEYFDTGPFMIYI